MRHGMGAPGGRDADAVHPQYLPRRDRGPAHRPRERCRVRPARRSRGGHHAVDAGRRRIPASIRSSCSGTNYGARTGPVIQVQGQVRGGGAILPLTQAQLNTVTDQAHAYVASGLGTLVQQTGALSADIQAGNLASARTMWLTAHLTWERLGSAYGMFGGYDDSIDGLPDGLPGGVRDPDFTGFYRLEYGGVAWPVRVRAGPAGQVANHRRAITENSLARPRTRAWPRRGRPGPAHPRSPGKCRPVPAQRAR